MQCPYCENSIRGVGQQIKTLFSRRLCPHCDKPLKIIFDWKVLLTWFLPVVVAAVILQYLLGRYGLGQTPWAAAVVGLATGVLLVMSMRLDKYR